MPGRATTIISRVIPLSSARGVALESSETNERLFVRQHPTIEFGNGISAKKKGALLGAGVGLLAGLTGGFLVAQNIHCGGTERLDAPACHASRRRVGYVLLTGTGGAVIGALVGAGIGEFVHAIRRGATP